MGLGLVRPSGTALVFAGLMSACAPVTDIRLRAVATANDGSETFRGEIHGPAYGDGVLTLKSAAGVTCVGTYSHHSQAGGTGEFTCSDTRKGVFEFQTKGFSAKGTGTLEGKPFTFRVGRAI